MAFEYTDEEKKMVLKNSIERVINSTLACLDIASREAREDELEKVDINQEDWNELKQLTVKIWNEKRDQIFREMNELA